VSKFRNLHVSVSRLKKFEGCPFSFYCQYIDKQPGERPLAEPAEFGNVLHETLESVYQWILDNEFCGRIDPALVEECYRAAWTSFRLSGLALYEEGLDLAQRYCRDRGTVDYLDTICVEREFNILLGPDRCELLTRKLELNEIPDGCFVVNGFIDRVDHAPGEGIEIIDYKSNRLLFSEDELAADIQMGIYSIVGRLMFPWAKSIGNSFHMLRHFCRQTTVRTEEDLRITAQYILALAERTEKTTQYQQIINTNCGYCDCKHRCDEYKRALDRFDPRVVAPEDAVSLLEERERVANIAKLAYAKKDEIDELLKVHLDNQEQIVANGIIAKLVKGGFDTDYDTMGVVRALLQHGVPKDEAYSVLDVSTTKLQKLLQKVEKNESIPETDRYMLRPVIGTCETKSPRKDRLDVKREKAAPKAKSHKNYGKHAK
jgi:RecB family exonuclease